jgi:hypothetical protein
MVDLTSNPLLRFSSHLSLQSAHAVLLVNVPIPLLLCPVLEDHGDAENENHIDSDNPESGSEDLVKIAVGERGELANATTLLRRDKSIDASAVLYKGR